MFQSVISDLMSVCAINVNVYIVHKSINIKYSTIFSNVVWSKNKKPVTHLIRANR